MRDKDLYQKILGIESPWRVVDIDLTLEAQPGKVTVKVEAESKTQLHCPHCGKPVPRYDKRHKEWRHLDTCQYQTILAADVPRVKCPEHGVSLVKVPWAEPGSGFTALFEALAINWLKEASISAVSRQLGLSWNAIDGIMQRAVRRGLARRDLEAICKRMGVDETAFRKRQDYVTVVTDQERGHVLYVADDRKKASLVAYYESLTEEQREAIECISMDMWQGFIGATLKSIPGAEKKIAFDKFHIAQYLGDAVNKVRREEHKALLQVGNEILKGSKYAWQTNPDNMSTKDWRAFKDLRNSNLKTARAWAIKEYAMSLWNYVSRTWAEKGWERWYSWAIRSRLEPIKKVARMVKKHLWGIINAVVLDANNGHAESTNSKIKMVKVRSRGFRNKDRFKTAIYFHLGGLDLYPAGAK
jgi:transposase